MSYRTIDSIKTLSNDHTRRGFRTWDMGDAIAANDVDPFIMTTLFEMSESTFAPHLHAGLAVATYILPESKIGFINQDSTGTRNRIEPGAIHVTVAGSGTV